MGQTFASVEAIVSGRLAEGEEQIRQYVRWQEKKEKDIAQGARQLIR